MSMAARKFDRGLRGIYNEFASLHNDIISAGTACSETPTSLAHEQLSELRRRARQIFSANRHKLFELAEDIGVMAAQEIGVDMPAGRAIMEEAVGLALHDIRYDSYNLEVIELLEDAMYAKEGEAEACKPLWDAELSIRFLLEGLAMLGPLIAYHFERLLRSETKLNEEQEYWLDELISGLSSIALG